MRITPCESWPRRFARTSKDAIQVASAAGAFQATKMSRVIRSSVSTSTIRMRRPPGVLIERLLDSWTQGARDRAGSRARLRHRRREFLAGRRREARLRLPRALGGETRPRLLLDLRLRPERAAPSPAGVPPHHQRDVRHHAPRAADRPGA